MKRQSKKRQREILESKFVITNNGMDIVGPISLEHFYYILKFGGERRGNVFVIRMEMN